MSSSVKHPCTSCLLYKLVCLPSNLFVAVLYVSWMSPFRHTHTHTYIHVYVTVCVCCVHTCVSDINCPRLRRANSHIPLTSPGIPNRYHFPMLLVYTTFL